MLKIAVVLTLVHMLLLSVSAQNSPPGPPPPSIFKKPDAAKVRDFVAEQDGFSVSFAGGVIVERVSNPIADISVYTVRAEGMTLSVLVMHSKRGAFSSKNIVDEFRNGLMLHNKKQKIDSLKIEIESEREVNIGEIKITELTYRDSMTRTHTGIVVRNKTAFYLRAEAVNTHILKHNYPEKLQEFDEEAERFLRSFKFL